MMHLRVVKLERVLAVRCAFCVHTTELKPIPEASAAATMRPRARPAASHRPPLRLFRSPAAPWRLSHSRAPEPPPTASP
jgi:hypothetical protein